jgi:hypothetical protein
MSFEGSGLLVLGFHGGCVFSGEILPCLVGSGLCILRGNFHGVPTSLVVTISVFTTWVDSIHYPVANASGKGLGLSSMRERVENVQGILRIESDASGTHIEACLPCKRVCAEADKGKG